MLKIGDTLTVDFVLYSPFTGNPKDADADVACYLFEGSALAATASTKATKRVANAGAYMATFSTDDLVVGTTYNIHTKADVSGVPIYLITHVFTIEAVRASGTYGDDIDVGTPGVVGFCRIYTFISEPDSLEFPAVCAGTAQIVSIPYAPENIAFLETLIAGTYDNMTGLFFWDVVYGANVKLTIPSIGLDWMVMVPFQSTALLSTLL